MNKTATYYRIVFDLPKELGDLVRLFCNPYDEYYEGQIEKVVNKYLINHTGFVSNDTFIHSHHCADNFSKSDYYNIIKCKCEILLIYKPLKTAGRYGRNDYMGKSYIENYRMFKKDRYYLSSGEYIVALILAGYIPILTKKTGYKSSHYYAVKRNRKTGLPIY